jgi:methyl-accepting chemotaxis protein
VQSDAVVSQLDRIADIQMTMAIAMSIIAVFALAIAVAALIALLKVRKAMERGLNRLPSKTDPVLTAVTRVAENAREVSETVKVRIKDMLDNLEQINDRLKLGADAIEDRVKRFGVVVDVVQTEAEELLLDAASTARGVHTAAEQLRQKRGSRLPAPDLEPDDEVFDE